MNGSKMCFIYEVVIVYSITSVISVAVTETVSQSLMITMFVSNVSPTF